MIGRWRVSKDLPSVGCFQSKPLRLSGREPKKGQLFSTQEFAEENPLDPEVCVCITFHSGASFAGSACKGMSGDGYVIQFMLKAYDAVTFPGRKTLRSALSLAACGAWTDAGSPPRQHLTIQVVPLTNCFSYPTPASSLPLLPNQVAGPMSSGSCGTVGGSSSVGGRGGGRDKKEGTAFINIARSGIGWVRSMSSASLIDN